MLEDDIKVTKIFYIIYCLYNKTYICTIKCTFVIIIHSIPVNTRIHILYEFFINKIQLIFEFYGVKTKTLRTINIQVTQLINNDIPLFFR